LNQEIIGQASVSAPLRRDTLATHPDDYARRRHTREANSPSKDYTHCSFQNTPKFARSSQVSAEMPFNLYQKKVLR
jgi:hypothetical protein